MKINFLKKVISENKRRDAVVLASLVCLILVAFTPVASQLKTQKRITALQLGDGAQGARVTIVSDSALNDYEAYRRGERFYVKIPLADFTARPPSFRADGFEDVQVQKVGDSLVVSFRLQPGASAHVDQRSNRLDVIFSAPNRTLRSGSANGSNRVTPPPTSRNASDRGRDAAGPMPPGTALAFPRGATTYGAGQTQGVREGRNPRLPSNQSGNANRNAANQSTNQSGNQSGNRSGNQSNLGNAANKTSAPKPSPLGSPSSVLSPSTSTSLPPTTSATPATNTMPGSYQPTFSASPVSPVVASGTSSWQTRGRAAMKWVSANRWATLLGALILLALIIYLLMALGRRRTTQAKAKRLNAPKVQPKINPASEPAIEPGVQPTLQPQIEPPYSPAAPQPREFSSARPTASPTAPVAAVASVPDRPWVLTKPSISSPTAGPGEASSEEQEREVFEL